jgi:hypothetical protein
MYSDSVNLLWHPLWYAGTEYHDGVVTTALYVGEFEVRSQSHNWLASDSLLWFSSLTSGKWWDDSTNESMTIALKQPLQLIVHYDPIKFHLLYTYRKLFSLVSYFGRQG